MKNKLFSLLVIFGMLIVGSSSCKKEVEDEKATYTVTFDSDGGTAVAAQKVEDGAVAKRPTNPTKTGQKFASWYLGDKAYDFKAKVTKNITLKAKWEEDGK